MTTVPGFSSRSTSTTVRQFPQRDEAAMSNTPGFSNSPSDHETRVTAADVVAVNVPATPEVKASAPKKAARKPKAEGQ